MSAPAPRHRRHLPLALLLGALIAWPVLHHAPPTTCPPGTLACPLDRNALANAVNNPASSQLVIVHRPQ